MTVGQAAGTASSAAITAGQAEGVEGPALLMHDTLTKVPQPMPTRLPARIRRSCGIHLKLRGRRGRQGGAAHGCRTAEAGTGLHLGPCRMQQRAEG